MRVLHVTGGDLYGGIERMLATLASTRSHAVRQQFAVSSAGRLWRELLEAGVDRAALPGARASRPLSVLMARRSFARMISSLDPEAVIFHGSWAHAIFATVAAERGLVVAFWQHAPIVHPRWPDRWAAWTVPDVLIANSRFTASAPAFPGITPNVIHCPVPPSAPLAAHERARRRAALGAGDTDVVVLMAARLEAWKGHPVLIEAARLLGRNDVKVWIAGGVQRSNELPYFQHLQSEIERAGAGTSVSLLGERDDVQVLMKLADVYCQPNSAPEPFGIAIAEAMRAGLPCVVTRAGGAAELIDGECGILTPAGDAAAVAAALSTLASDARQRDAMGQAASRRASSLTDPAAKLRELATVLTKQPAHAV